MLDEEVQIFGGIGVEWRRKDTAIAKRPGSELHAALHPSDDFFRVEIADRAIDQLASRQQVAESELAVLEDFLDFLAVIAWTKAQVVERRTLLLAQDTVPGVEHCSQCRTGVSTGRLDEHVLRLLERADQQRIQRQAAGETKVLTRAGHAEDHALHGSLETGRERRMHLNRNFGSFGQPDLPVELFTETTFCQAVGIEVGAIENGPVRVSENLFEERLVSTAAIRS